MPDITELNRISTQAESVDSDLFSEQRSNILLVAGDHYTKKTSKYWTRIRDSESLTKEQKLRLTKNHIQKITKTYVNNIVSYAPGVGVRPNNESELQDQKSAELHNSALSHIKKRANVKKLRRQWAEDYINVGEVAVKIFFDPYAGDHVGYDEQGNAVFKGKLTFERIFGFNLLRAPEAKSMDESSVVVIRKMMDTEALKKSVENDSTKMGYVESSRDETYLVFEGQSGDYRNVKDQTLVREYYFRPCSKYPKGWFAIATTKGILFEGELPFGIFPIVYCGFDELETSPRARSIIKQLRPCQIEINRASSLVAEHQTTLGSDKLLIQKGTTIAHGGQVPGVRAVQYTGAPPQILEGRTGAQYLEYIQAQISEMYSIANLVEDSEEKQTQLDPYSLLFSTMRNKKRFSLYAEKFAQFLVEVHTVALELYRQYVDENELIEVLGRRELVNIQEFKNSKPLGYQITLEEQSDDIESKMGKLLSMNHIIQYAGNKLENEDIGKIISSLPYVNEEQAFGDLTIDFKNANNDILALDRGEYPQVNQFDNHKYAIKRLTSRMKQSDFRLLPPQIQLNYKKCLKEHEFVETENQRKIIAAQSEYIPTDGYFVVCDYYVPDIKDPLRKQRVKVPANSLKWLIERLKDQGTQEQELMDLQPEAQADLASELTKTQGAVSPWAATQGEMNV